MAHLYIILAHLCNRTACTLSTKYEPKQFSTKLEHTHHHSLHPPSCYAPCKHANSKWKFLPALPVVQACVTCTVDTTTPIQDSDDCCKSSYDDPSLKPGIFTTYSVGGWIDRWMSFIFHFYSSAFTTTLQHPLLSLVIHYFSTFSTILLHSLIPFSIHDLYTLHPTLLPLRHSLLLFLIHYYASSFTTTLQLSPCSSLWHNHSLPPTLHLSLLPFSFHHAVALSFSIIIHYHSPFIVHYYPSAYAFTSS